MSRRTNKKRKFPIADSVYDSFLVNLMISKILKSGKKTVAQKIIYEAFDIIKERTNNQPLKIFEQAVKNVSPAVKI